MSGIDFRGRRRFRDSEATERLAALLGHEDDGAELPAGTGHGGSGGFDPVTATRSTDDSARPDDADGEDSSRLDPSDPFSEGPSFDPSPDSPDNSSEGRSRHREDVVIRRGLSRPAVVVLCAVLLLAVVLGGISLLSGGDDDAVVTSAAVSGHGADEENATSHAPSGESTRGTGRHSGAHSHGASGSPSSGTSTASEAGESSGAQGKADAAVLTVHVVGEVKDPSVVTLSPGARVMDAVQAAGGFTSAAVKDRINLAQPVQDGAQITIPNAGNADQVAAGTPVAGAAGGTGGAAGSTSGSSSGTSSGAGAGSSAASGAGASGTGSAGTGAGTAAGSGGAPVNLNTATVAELDTLPRVGPVLAQRIVDFRTEHGPFTAVEQIDDVSGVGPAMLEALLPLLTV
ncbi:ComEA family DNA-binding protein [Kocuria varians]|uniref:ComEA family DNA-binding protein n=1 Tax=Kocuria varians TaxID=1272 RepID=UPI000838C2AC|nr:ComEA family DNA-binding protein [Kocuria varians]